MDHKLAELYAEFAVRSGVNIQKDQTLFVHCPIECDWFGRLCAAAAYKAGARDVVMIYIDELFSRLRMQEASEQALVDIKPWVLARYMEYVGVNGGCAALYIAAGDPELYKGIDPEKVNKVSQAARAAQKPFTDLRIANKVQWSIVSVPTEVWAKKIFPGCDGAAAVEQLWEAIFKVCRVAGGDPVGAWKEHAENTQKRVEQINALGLTALHFTASNGTDLTVGLPEHYEFTGVGDRAGSDVLFFANIPSEEVFAAPHRDRVNGVVKSSLPYVYNGNLIEGITARFENGIAVEASAEKGNDLLQHMMDADEGARRLGEIALVPASSPIRATGLLYYNTLFDENAACHMAFGAGYPSGVKGGTGMTPEQLLAAGINDSLIHEDIMIGTPDMNIDGILEDGSITPVFRNGEWAI